MTSEERRNLIIDYGQDICDYCEKRFPYVNCNNDTCRCVEEQFYEEVVKPHS